MLSSFVGLLLFCSRRNHTSSLWSMPSRRQTACKCTPHASTPFTALSEVVRTDNPDSRTSDKSFVGRLPWYYTLSALKLRIASDSPQQFTIFTTVDNVLFTTNISKKRRAWEGMACCTHGKEAQ